LTSQTPAEQTAASAKDEAVGFGAPEEIKPFAKLEFTMSPNFGDWLASVDSSVAFTVLNNSKLVFVGRSLEDNTVTTSEGNFARCLGVGVHADMRSLTVAAKHQVIRFENLAPPGVIHEGHDAVFVPHRAWITGYLDTHDMATMANKSLLFVNTKFSCLATVVEGYSFRPVWQPYFITQLVPEDRCHLNGMAIDGDRPRFVTAVSETDTLEGWRSHLSDGGLLIDVDANVPILKGLSMPHSPRIHGGRLWMLESGHGIFGYVDLVARKLVPVAFCPGFARGLALMGNYAVICLSLPRDGQENFDKLPLGEILTKRGEKPRCGLMVVDLRNGETVASLDVHDPARDLFDVVFLPGVRNPKVVDFMSDDIDRIVLMDQRS
jgi:uncharacterized protein (TIGR03032 family)